MVNPLKVSLENIVPLTYARDHFSQIVSEVQQDKLFVLTKGGKPAVAIIDVRYLESITGGQVQKEDIREEIKKAPEKVGLPPMVEHPPTKPAPPSPPAGFAAPQMKTAPIPKPESQPLPKPTPPPPPPPAPKIELKPIAPPPLKTEPVKPASTLVMPPTPVPNDTPPPVQKKTEEGDQVSVEFAPDDSTLEKQEADGKKSEGEKTAPDDKNPPAQYAGESPPAGGEPEPEDMALD